MGSSRNRATKPKMCTVSISGCLYIGTLKTSFALLFPEVDLTNSNIESNHFGIKDAYYFIIETIELFLLTF